MIAMGRAGMRYLLAFFLCQFVASASHAVVFYNNGTSLANSGMWSEKGPFMSPGNGFTELIRAGDTFMVSAPSTLGVIRWWGWNVGPTTDQANSFEVLLYAMNGNTANETPIYSYQPAAVTRTAVGDFAGSYEYVASIAPFHAAAHTHYLLSIVNDFATPNDLSDSWSWRRSIDGPDGTHSSKQDIGGPLGNWMIDGFTHDLAFQLSSPVPEANAALSLGLGLLAMAAVARRRRSSAS